jgi:histidine triad (HIT) family protein
VTEDCLFCKIVEKKLPAEFVHETGDVIVIKDIHPQAPTHLLVIPRKHIERLSAATEVDGEMLGGLLKEAGRLIRKNGLEENSRIVINNGAHAGQSVFHIHVHVLGGRNMGWPPG